jgi:hypothetical protein
VYTPLVASAQHPSYYVVILERVRVGSKDMSVHAGSNLKASYAKGYGTVLDSGK